MIDKILEGLVVTVVVQTTICSYGFTPLDRNNQPLLLIVIACTYNVLVKRFSSDTTVIEFTKNSTGIRTY